jgi:succinate dehydrogenase flavin-adding protein (antitoxin of CptAB toxin-antitoxin module)
VGCIWLYAGKPEYLALLVARRSVRTPRYSDNVTSAENQQERLIQLGWVIGFVDGEGCFSIGFVRQPDRTGRKGYKTGYQVAHEFAVTQGAKSVRCLEDLVTFFGVGSVIANRRYDNHKEHLYRYVVRRRKDLIDTIIPFFYKHPMRSSKQQDFERFSRCVELIDQDIHRTHAGLADIAEIAQTMNRQKPRHDLIRILRGHTPEVQDTGS